MKYFSFILFLIIINDVWSQSTCPARLQEYKFTKEIYKYDESRLQQEYSYLGLYRESLPEKFPIAVDTGTSISNFRTSDRYLDSIASKNMVILNEAHNVVTSNRVFLYSILDSLKSLGFNDIFMEALSQPDDSLVSLRITKYPTTATGAYIQEPVFGEVVRKMLNLNMALHAYEEGYDDPDTISRSGKVFIIDNSKPNWIPVEADTFILHYLYDISMKRLVKQALNIFQTVMRLKINKVFIYSGFGNGAKSGPRMGTFLNHMMHVDPYIIDQIILTERQDTTDEDPVFRRFSNLKSYYYLTKPDGGAIHSTINILSKVIVADNKDMIIGTPRTSYLHNRENWLELNGDRKRYPLADFLDTCELSEDFLVVVYYENEYSREKKKATPADVIQVFKKNGDYDLVLRPAHQYHIFAFIDGKTVADKTIAVP